ncbi:MAG: hypothetical protein HQ518_05420, partial [Rhodopirellula sp.]|nr:hypothetical protein [Rhodopirellula sp.]
VPVVAEAGGSVGEHGQGTVEAPAHAGAVQAILDDETAGAFDDATGNRVALAQATSTIVLSEGAIKQLTGGKSWTGRKMRQDNWQFALTHKFAFETNNMPQFSDDPALWDRIIVIEFSRRFWDEDKDSPGPAKLKQDRNLRKKLTEEASGILAWMVQGCRQVQDFEGLRSPACILTEGIYQRRKNGWMLAQFLPRRTIGCSGVSGLQRQHRLESDCQYRQLNIQ